VQAWPTLIINGKDQPGSGSARSARRPVRTGRRASPRAGRAPRGQGLVEKPGTPSRSARRSRPSSQTASSARS